MNYIHYVEDHPHSIILHDILLGVGYTFSFMFLKSGDQSNLFSTSIIRDLIIILVNLLTSKK